MSKIEKYPDGWLTKKLAYLIKSMDAGVSVNSEDRKAQKGEYGILKTSAVTTGVFDPDENKTIIATEIKRAKISPTRDRIIMSRMNTPALVGANAYIPQTREDLFLPDRLWQLVPEEGRANMRWLSFVLGSPKYRSKLSSFATGTSNSMKNITKGDVKFLPILLPPLPEQKAIADLLSTWDEAIEKTERLIQAKEKQFKWLLRSLISDQCSMNNEKWKKVKLGEVGEPYSGLTGKNKNDFGSGKPYLPYLNVYQNFRVDPTVLDYVNITERDNQRKICKGDVFFTVSSETPDEVGVSSVLLDDIGECYLNSFCFGWRLNSDELLFEYLQFYFRSTIFRKQMIRLAQGATRFNLSKIELMKAFILFPSIFKQKQIAETLSTAQKEIDLLKQLAEKYKTQKRGLMQKMLTGEWRVKLEIIKQYEEV